MNMAESSLQEQLQNLNMKKPRVAPEVQKEEVHHELISQDNALTQSRYDFSPTEKNVLYRIIQKVRHDYVEGTVQQDLFKNMYVTIDSKDLAKIADAEHTARAKNALKSLHMKPIEIEHPNGDWLYTSFINYAKYDSKAKTYEVEVSKEIMPYLVELARNFTTFSLTVAIALKSKYSQRIYEMCCQYKARGTFFFEAAKLRQMLKLEDKYTQNQDFKRKVLDVAYEELKRFFDNGQSDLWFEYTTEGRGENIRYAFKIHSKDGQQQLLFKETYQRSAYLATLWQNTFRKDPKYVQRFKDWLNFHPDELVKLFDRVTNVEKDYKKKDLPKVLRIIARLDYGIN